MEDGRDERIKELERENAELKKKFEDASKIVPDWSGFMYVNGMIPFEDEKKPDTLIWMSGTGEEWNNKMSGNVTLVGKDEED